MRSRAEDLGGSVEVVPRAGGGVQVTAWLPLPTEPLSTTDSPMEPA